MSELELRGFQERVKARLRSRGWSVIRLSQESGISDAVIYRWLRDRAPKRPSDANLKKLAPVLGDSYEELLRLAGYLPGESAPIEDDDSDLALVNAAWPRLSDGLREAIKILAGRGGGASSPSNARVSRVSAARVREPARAAAGNAGRKPTLTAPYRPLRRLLTRRAAACILDGWLTWLRPWQPALA